MNTGSSHSTAETDLTHRELKCKHLIYLAASTGSLQPRSCCSPINYEVSSQQNLVTSLRVKQHLENSADVAKTQ